MTGEQLRSRPVAGKWSTLEVVCHVADREQFFAHGETGLVTLRQLLLHAVNHLRHNLRFVAEKRAAIKTP
jgi:hypothetical protein